MLSIILLIILTLTLRTYAVGPFGLNNTHCTQQFFSVPITSTNIKFTGFDQTNLSQPFQTELIIQFITSETNFTQLYTNGTFELTRTFNISGTLCTPIVGARKDSALQVLVHGVSFDSSYWDFGFSPNLSYVRAAASYGYSTFRYDRLGTGLSETPANGFDIAQAATETAILETLIRMLQTNGTQLGTPPPPSPSSHAIPLPTHFPRVVGIGHSYGAFQLQSLTSTHPDLLSGTILQGFSANGTGFPFTFASAAFSPAHLIFPTHPQLSNKPPTWLVTGTPAATQPLFWSFPYYDPLAFEFAREREQAVTVGTFVSIGSLVGVARVWDRPMMVVVGDRDYIVAFGDAYASGLSAPVVDSDSDSANETVVNAMTIPGLVRPMLYPNLSVENFEVYIPAFTGHAINTHFSAPETFGRMLQFVINHNL